MDPRKPRLKVVSGAFSPDEKPSKRRYNYDSEAVYFVSVYAREDFLKALPDDADEKGLRLFKRPLGDKAIETAGLRPGIRMDAASIKDNSVHLILVISDCPRTGQCEDDRYCGKIKSLCDAPVPGELSTPDVPAIEAMVDRFKILSAKALSVAAGEVLMEDRVWQRGFFCIPVRSDADLARCKKNC